jgi:hypothetical protein
MGELYKMSDLTPIEIDLGKMKDGKLDESFLEILGFQIQGILKALFGGSSVPVSVRGSKPDVNSFLKTLGAEKNYIESFKRYGLDNPRTFRNKATLQSSISQFERGTGIKWPFK